MINGINSYGIGSYYSYQAALNNIRLTQALSNNPQIQSAAESVTSVKDTPLQDSFDFVKEYTSEMSSLMKAAAELKSANSSGVMNDFTPVSSDSSVAIAAENLTIRNPKNIRMDVSQIAAAQVNASDAVRGADRAAGDMDFTISTAAGSVNVQVNAAYENGTLRTNTQMLREAAAQINESSIGIRASVVREDDQVSLKLESERTGATFAFQTSGQMGAAAGAERVQTAAENAQYSVTTDGVTRNYTSSGNDITVDGGRIRVTLTGTGETEIRSDVDMEQVSSAVENLVDRYNDALALLNDNYDRGTGIDRQLRSLVRGLGSEQSLEMLGITVNKDATLNFDKAVLAENMEKNPSLVRDLISGTGGIADTAFNKAVGGMNMNSSSLINKDMASAQSESLNNPFNILSMYSRNGAYLQNQYYAVGLMMNYLV